MKANSQMKPASVTWKRAPRLKIRGVLLIMVVAPVIRGIRVEVRMFYCGQQRLRNCDEEDAQGCHSNTPKSCTLPFWA